MFMWILPGLWLFHSYTIHTTTSKHSTADDRQYFMKVQYQRYKTHSYQHDFQISVTKICDNTFTSTVTLVAALVFDAHKHKYKIIYVALDNSMLAGNKN